MGTGTEHSATLHPALSLLSYLKLCSASISTIYHRHVFQINYGVNVAIGKWKLTLMLT